MTDFGFRPEQKHFAPTSGPVKLQPSQFAQVLQRGIELQRNGDFREAEHQYQLVLYNAPKNAEALNLMGTISIEANALKTAIDYMKRAVKNAPNNAIFRNNLGNAYLQQKEFALAKKHLRKAVLLKRDFIEPLCNLGKTYKLMLKGAEGEKAYLRALEIDPNSEMALVGLADLIVDNGRPSEAAAYFRRALDLDPSSVEALTGLAATQKFKPGAPEIEMILKQIEHIGNSDETLVRLHHAAGKILNDQGEYQRAISHYSTGKTISKNDFNIPMHKQLYDSMISSFDRQFFEDRAGYGDASERPVFIIGMPRSGTTLTEQICASHPEVYGAGELSNIRTIANEVGFGDLDPAVFTDRLCQMTKAESVALAAKYLTALKKFNQSARRVVDKMPHNYELVALIALLFPNAKIINCNRDAMDNCLSCFTHNFSESHGYNANLETVGLYYREYDRLMAHWYDVAAIPILKMQYEDTVGDTETRSRALIDFIGLEWDEACLAFHQTERTVRTPSRWQVRQPIYATSVKRWKRYGDSLAPLQAALGDLVD